MSPSDTPQPQTIEQILEAVRIGGWYDANPNSRQPDYLDVDVALAAIQSFVEGVIGAHESPLDPKKVGPVEYGIGMGRYELKAEQHQALAKVMGTKTRENK